MFIPKLLIDVLGGMLIASFIYWTVQRLAFWWDKRHPLTREQTDGIGMRKDGRPIFDHHGRINE